MSAGGGGVPDPDTDTARDLGDGKDPVPAGDDGASSEQSGYRRDDYWRKVQEGLPADVEPESAHGQDFETPRERARSGPGAADGDTGGGTDGADDSGDDSGRTADPPQATPPHAK